MSKLSNKTKEDIINNFFLNQQVSYGENVFITLVSDLTTEEELSLNSSNIDEIAKERKALNFVNPHFESGVGYKTNNSENILVEIDSIEAKNLKYMVIMDSLIDGNVVAWITLDIIKQVLPGDLIEIEQNKMEIIIN